MAAPTLVDNSLITRGLTDASNQKTDSITLTVGANFLMIQVCWVDGTQQNVASMSYNGVDMTQVASALIQVDATSVSRGWPSADLWYQVNPLTGSAANRIITLNGGQPTDIFDGYTSWSGVNTSDPVGTAAVSLGTVGATSLNLAPTTTTDDIAIGLIVSSTNATTDVTVSGDGAEAWEQEDATFGTTANCQYLAHSGGTSTTLSWTKPGGTRRSVGTSVAIHAAAGAGGDAVPQVWMQYRSRTVHKCLSG